MHSLEPVKNRPTLASFLTILSGMAGSIISLMAFVFAFADYAEYRRTGYVSGYGIYIADLGTLLLLTVVIEIWIMLSSALVLVGGVKIRSHPADHKKWGNVILVFSVFGLGPQAYSLAFAGFWYVGILVLILGIIGGLLALAFKPIFRDQAIVDQPPAYNRPNSTR